MTPDDSVISGLIESTKANLKNGPELLPCFFVGYNGGLQVIGAPFGDDAQKDAVASFIKTKAKDADFILFVAESWTIKDQAAAKEYLKNRSDYGHDMSSHPKAVEVVMFQLETRTRCWHAVADILQDRTLGEVKWVQPTKMEGRFSNLMGEKPGLH